MSKPTPNNATKKTASARSVVVLIAACLALLAVVLLAHNWRTAALRVNGRTYALRVADTDAARQRGLGGRASLAQNAGMLFAFPSIGRQCFWMKDMHFSLDMIWTDSNKRVVYMAQNLSPASYPNVYCANGTQYVIELNAGQVALAHIKDGEALSF